MKLARRYEPDRFKPLIPPPPLFHKDIEKDRENMRRYARQRYIEGLKIDTDD